MNTKFPTLKTLSLTSSLAALALLPASDLRAESGTWLVNAPGNWSDPLNWTGGIVADGADFTATFGNIIDAARTITLDTPRTIGNITASDTSNDYIIGGSETLTLDVTSGKPVITNSGGSNRNVTINALLAGTDGLQKSGNGGVNLTNTGNAFTGGITLAGGRLNGSDARVYNGNDITVTATSTLQGFINSAAPNNVLTGKLSLDANLAISIPSAAWGFSHSGVLEGSGTLSVTGASTSGVITNFTNSGNTFTGALNNGSGTTATGGFNFSSFVDSANPITLGSSSTSSATFGLNGTAPVVFNERQFVLGTNGSHTANINNNSAASAHTLTVNTALSVTSTGTKTFTLGGTNTGTNTFAGVIANGTGTVNFAKAGAGRWILTAENTYTGSTTLSGGVLVLNTANALPGGIATTGGTSNLTLAGGVLGLATGDFTRPLGASSNAEAVTFGTGGGGWAAYGADRLVNLGGAGAPIAWADPDTGFNAQPLVLSFASATHKVTLPHDLDLGTATRTVTVNNGSPAIDAVLSGILSGTGGLTKNGSGVLSLSNANTYAGATTVGAGMLKLDDANALPGGIASTGGTSSLTITGGGIVGLTSSSGNFNRPFGTGAAQARFTGGGGFAAFGGTRTVQFSASSINWNATNFVTAGSTLILGHANADGTLQWNQPFSLAGSARTIQVNNGSAAVDAIISANVAGGTSGSSNNFTKTGAGTLAFTANGMSYWGPTTISAGTLTVGNGGTNGLLSVNSASTSVAAGATLAVNRSNEVSQSASNGLGNGNALISGEGSFAQIGSGTTTLTLANTYSGGTTVSAGTLVAASSGALGGGPVSVTGGTLNVATGVTLPNPVTLAAGGTVAGVGTLTAASDTVAGTVSPGDSAGTLTFANTALSLTGAVNLEIGGTTAGSHDVVAAAGTITLSGPVTVTFINGFVPEVGQSWDLFSEVGGLTSTATLNLPTLPEGLAWNTSSFATTGQIGVVTGGPLLSASASVSSFAETAASPASVVTVSVPADPLADLIITITADSSEVTVPATVTIPSGQTSATFNVAAVNDGIADGDQMVSIGLSAAGYTAGSVNVTVTDVGVANPYVGWQSSKFTGPELLDPAVSGDNADPDGDGLSNALEYAFGTEPKSGTSGAYLPQSTVVAGNLELSYRRPVGGVPGVTYSVEVNSTGLAAGGGNWDPAVPTVDYNESAPVANGDGTETVTITFTNGVGGAGRKFGRVKVAF